MPLEGCKQRESATTRVNIRREVLLSVRTLKEGVCCEKLEWRDEPTAKLMVG